MDGVRPAAKPPIHELEERDNNTRIKQANQQSDAESLNATKRVAQGQKPDLKNTGRKIFLTTGIAAARLFNSSLNQENAMDKEHIKGAADQAKGAVKDAAGKVVGSEKLQAEGRMEKAKGAAEKTAGDVKDAAKRMTE